MTAQKFVILVKNGRVLGVDTGGISGVRYIPMYYEEPPVGVDKEEYQTAFDETLALFMEEEK